MRSISRPAPRSSIISSGAARSSSRRMRGIPTISPTGRARRAGRPLAPLPFDGRLLGADFDLVRPPIGEFMALGGMMIGRDDIEPLARPFSSAAAFARCSRCCGGRDRPPALSARHAAGDGQCARGEAVYSLRRNRRANLGERVRCRRSPPRRSGRRRGDFGRRQGRAA